MIRILRTPASAFYQQAGLDPACDGVIVLRARAPFHAPWELCRQWLAHARARLGDGRIGAAVAPHAAQLGLVLGGLALGGRPVARPWLPTFLSHNGLVQAPLRDAWVAVLAALAPDASRFVAVPEAAAADVESLSVMRALADRFAEGNGPDLVFGHDASARPGELHAQRSFDLAETELVLLEARHDACVETHAPAAAPLASAPATSAELLVDPLDDRLEWRAWEALSSGATADARALARLAMRAAFDARGHAAVIQLGLALLACNPPLAPAARGEAHALVALAAYNRQVESGGNVALAAFLAHHFEAALSFAPGPIEKSMLAQRLAMCFARRKGELARAEALVERAITAAQTPGIASDVAAFLEGWARNGRAYVLHRRGRHEEAYLEGVRALEAVESVHPDEAAHVPPRELPATVLVFLDNVAELATASGDRARALAWQTRVVEAEARLTGAAIAAYHRLLALLRRDPRDLRRALEAARRALAEARRARDVIHEDRYAAELGDLLYRAGDADGALASFEVARAIRRRVATAADARQMEIRAALSALRAGRPEHAASALERVLEERAGGAPAEGAAKAASRLVLMERAELRALRGVAAAVVGDAEGAEAWLNDAIDQAVQSGAGRTLARVALAAGEASLRLGRADDAHDAFARALSITDADASAAHSDVLRIIAARASLGAASPAEIARALTLLPTALDDGEAWWALPALLAGVQHEEAAGRLGRAHDAATELLRTCAGQRSLNP